MAIDITVIRHGETEGNLASVWQGHADSPLTPLGRRQAEDLGGRIAGRTFDRVVASDLGRAMDTARIAGLEPTPMAGLREVNIGAWEGLSREDVLERFPNEIEALGRGEDVPLGGGESWSGFGARIHRVLEEIVRDAGDGERVAVVAHGGVVHSVVSWVLGFNGTRPWPISRARNTSLTRIRVDGSRRSLAVYNDATHTEASDGDTDGTIIGLVRHGESEGNVADRWQGRSDGALTERGAEQAARLASWYDGLAHVYTSPLSRARDTASALSAAHGLTPTVLDDVIEMSFGEWENKTTEEILALDPERVRLLYEEGVDAPRGTTGETYAGVSARMRSAIDRVAENHVGDRVGIVSHGAAIRAFTASVVGITFRDRHRLALPTNASVAHVLIGPLGSTLMDYNLPGG